ncbi:MAG: EAL and HDOD domain-containing protein [Steroidobacteraceae bacterium]
MNRTTDQHSELAARQAAPAQAPAHSLALIARQPIYAPAMTVLAYQLLYLEADTAAGSAAVEARDAALRVVADAALEIGLDRLAGELPVHIRYPRELLASPSPLSMHPERVVIEWVEDLPSDTALLDGLRQLRTRGHRIALDDYSPRLNDPALLDDVDIVKVDVSQHSLSELERFVPALVRRGLTLIAEEVETVEQFDHSAQLGFAGFQGDFLQRPETFKVQRMPTSRLATLRLISALQNEQYSIKEVEGLVSQDLSLSFRVLRCINSSFYNLPRKVESIRQAIVILGLDNLRQLATLVSLQGLDNRPASLFVTSMTRARMCEQLARLAGVKDTGPYFLAGLFSLLDVLTGTPISELLDELPLTPAVGQALVSQEGDVGVALKCARAYERASWGRVSYNGLAPALIRAAYVDAVFWAEQTQALTGKI